MRSIPSPLAQIEEELAENDKFEAFEKCAGSLFELFGGLWVLKLGQRGCPRAARRSKRRLVLARNLLRICYSRVSKKQKALGLGSRVVSSDATPPDNPSDRVSTPKVRRKARTNFPHIFQKLQTCRSRPILLRFRFTKRPTPLIYAPLAPPKRLPGPEVTTRTSYGKLLARSRSCLRVS
jgi:hypothetical protein